ncbi:MAG: hypothetical protein WAN58_09825 [Anaerolineales bacterium]
MTTYVVKIEGRNNIPVPEDVAKDEQKLRRALSAVVNGIADAKIEYHEEKEGVVEIEVIKRAGAKGIDDSQALVLADLMKRPEKRNPAIACFLRLSEVDKTKLDPARMFEIGDEVDKALADGEQQGKDISRTHEMLVDAPSAGSSLIVLGL